MSSKLIDLFYYFKTTNYPRITYGELDQAVGGAILNQRPLMIGRLGASESAALRMQEFGYSKKKEKCFEQLCKWSGFFPQRIDLLERFADTYKRSIPMTDILYPMGYKGENYLIKKYAGKAIRFTEGDILILDGPDVWTRHLKGKKVLVIHPFEDTIISQYARKREKIHANKDVLPEFELKTIKAVQTIAYEKDERFKDWFEALDYMHEEALKIEYDVALIGCGAYGFPLAAMLKNDGKVAIHLGGSLQLLFGIKGSRWDLSGGETIYNDNWVYPSEDERPKNYKLVESTSYWQTW